MSVQPEDRFERLTRSVTKASILHPGLTVAPAIVQIVEKEYKKSMAGAAKKKVAVALISSVLPDDFTTDAVVEQAVDLVFMMVKNKELVKLLKKNCSCI